MELVLGVKRVKSKVLYIECEYMFVLCEWFGYFRIV